MRRSPARSSRNHAPCTAVLSGVKQLLAITAVAGTTAFATACAGPGASPAAGGQPSVSSASASVASPSPVDSAAVGISPPVTLAEVQAAGGVYRLPLPQPPSVTATPGGVYVSWYVTNGGRPGSYLMTRIDPATGKIKAAVRLDGSGRALAADGSLWVAADGELLRLNPVTLVVTGRVRTEPGSGSIAVAGGALWVAGAGHLIRVSLVTGAITRLIRLPHAATSSVGSNAAGTVLFVATAADGGADVRIERRNPVTGVIIRSTPPAIAIAAPEIGGVIGPDVWYAQSGGMSGAVGRLDVVTLAHKPFSLGWNASNAIRVRTADGLVWVTQPGGGPRLNFCAAPATGRILSSLPSGAGSGTVLAIGGKYIYYLPETSDQVITRVRIPASCR